MFCGNEKLNINCLIWVFEISALFSSEKESKRTLEKSCQGLNKPKSEIFWNLLNWVRITAGIKPVTSNFQIDWVRGVTKFTVKSSARSTVDLDGPTVHEHLIILVGFYSPTRKVLWHWSEHYVEAFLWRLDSLHFYGTSIIEDFVIKLHVDI